MALNPDDTVCYCFKVSLQKIQTFCHTQKPHYASEISDCLSAGTGCGWCVPMLKNIHSQCCPPYTPPWRQGDATPIAEQTAEDPTNIDAQAWGAGRQKYLEEKKAKKLAE